MIKQEAVEKLAERLLDRASYYGIKANQRGEPLEIIAHTIRSDTYYEVADWVEELLDE